jgi:hypothetical protein
LNSSANPSSNGQNVTFTANVTGAGGTPSGTITFQDGTTTLVTTTLSSGVATFITNTLSVGTHPITAVYGGDSTFGGSTSAVISQTVDSGNSSSLVYFPLPKPIRVLDTRVGGQALYNGSNGNTKFIAGGTSNYKLADVTYGGYTIPAAAQVVVANTTAVAPVGKGFLTIYPGPTDASGANRPVVASLNYNVGYNIANALQLTLGTDGSANVYSLAETDVVMDVSGYYAPAGTADPNNFSNGLVYFPLPKPIRVLDTRAGTQALYNGGNGNTKFKAGGTSNYKLTDVTYGGYTIPAAARVLVANTTAVAPVGKGFVTIYPGPADANGANRPVVASLNYNVGSNTANAPQLTLGTDGSTNVYSLAETDVIIDVSGYYAPAGTADPNNFSKGLGYYPLSKSVRVLDTRAGTQATYNGSNGNTRFKAGGTNNYVLTGVSSIPSTAQVVVANTTAVAPAGKGYLTLYPGPADASGANRPVVASLNYNIGSNIANATQLTLGTDGSVNVYSLSETDVIIDVSGYYAQ